MTKPHQQAVLTEIEIVRQALKKGKHKRIRKLLRGMHPAKVASLLESLEAGQRSALWQQVDDEAEQKVLTHVSEKLRAFFRQDGKRAEEALAPEMDTHTELARLRGALEMGKLKRVRRMLKRIHPAKAAGFLSPCHPVSAPQPGIWWRARRQAAFSCTFTKRCGPASRWRWIPKI